MEDKDGLCLIVPTEMLHEFLQYKLWKQYVIYVTDLLLIYFMSQWLYAQLFKYA